VNTPAHLIIAAAAFAKPDQPRVNAAAILGAFVPDLSLYGMVIWNRFVQGMSFEQIFGREYFSDFWQQVFAIDNSLPVWLLVLGVGFILSNRVVFVFAAAAALHIALDLPLHHDDGRAHFWPFSDWIYESPISYWDPNHFGWLVGPLEALLCFGLLIILWKRFQNTIARAAIALAGFVEVAPAFLFPLLF